MPQVDAVAAGADPPRGRQLEHGPQPAGPLDDDEHEGGGRDRGQQDAAAEGERGVLTAQRHQPEQGDQRDGGDLPAVLGPPGRGGPGAVRGGVDEGERGAEHQAHDVGVGAVVDAGGAVGVEAQGHQRGGDHGQAERRGGAHLGAPGERQQSQHGQRPEQVELLLDGERPQVHQELRRGGREVVGAGADLEPVRGERERPEHLPLDADEQVALAEPGEQHGCRDAHQQRGQQPSCAARPEAGQVDAAAGDALAHQQGGDEEAGDDEEHVDAEEPAGQPGRVEVEDEDRQDRQGAQPVEAGQPPGRRGWSCRSLPVADLCVAPGRGGHGSAVSLHRAHAATVGAGGDRVTEARSWGRTPEAVVRSGPCPRRVECPTTCGG